jgi:hypothetical protein
MYRIGIEVFNAMYLNVLVQMREVGRRKKIEGAYFIVTISLHIFSSGNARRRVNGMRITNFSSVSPLSDRIAIGNQIL